MSDERVLVVGTTPDYVAHITERFPERALFLTDSMHRKNSNGPHPDASTEILCDLLDSRLVRELLESHLKKYEQELSGIVCYDCEWLVLASELAIIYDLPFPSTESIRLCRNKYLSKKRWSDFRIPCPATSMIRSVDQAIRFFEKIERPIVIKPLSGSGSELTFLCPDKDSIWQAMNLIKLGLQQRNDLPMYQPESVNNLGLDPREVIVVDEFIEGREYSCDVIIDGKNTTVVRIAKKIIRPGHPFGVTFAYIVPSKLPGWLDNRLFIEQLRAAAMALGITRAICMVDFIVSRNTLYFLEMTPRIGGDCLPQLIRQSSGLDTISLALDFAEEKKLHLPELSNWKTTVGLRIFAEQSGILKHIDVDQLQDDNKIKDIYFKRFPGQPIVLPPEDYDSWLLGHILFETDPDTDITTQCRELRSKIKIEMEPLNAQKFVGTHHESRGSAQS